MASPAPLPAPASAPPRAVDVQALLQESLTQVRSAAPRRPPELAEACAAALAKLKPNGGGDVGLGAGACLQVLKRACDMEGNPQVVCTALNCFQRLMPTDYFAGPSDDQSAIPAEAGSPPSLMMDNVIDVICNCSEQARDDVQLRLVRAISTAVTSPICEVHGKSLIRSVSTCFKVYKNSTNLNNQQIAKAALTQMVGMLIQLASVGQKALAATALADGGYPAAMPPEQLTAKTDGSEPSSGGSNTSWVKVPNPSNAERHEWVASYLDALIENVVATSAAASMRRGPRDEDGSPALSLQLRDALQVLLSFSKQSMKEPLPGQPERQFLRSKRISLEMVFCMLDTADSAFMASEHCSRIMTQTLCIALIKNSVSSLPDVFDLALRIFVTLVAKGRQFIKREIGVFITQVLLQIMTSGNSTYQHKLTAIQAVTRMCENAPIAIELFINFDCDSESEDVFAILVERLSQIAQGKYAASEHTSLIDPQQESELKVLALKALVTLSGSLADWAYRVPDGAEDAPDGLSVIMQRRKRKIALKTAVEKFNMKPKKGLLDLRESGFITDEASSLAALIRKENTGLDKTQLGDYLGDNKPFNLEVLLSLIDSFSFHELGVDTALRLLLSSFRLPGEAQKIDRIIDSFAKKFFADNPGIFANSDTAHILAFSVIMLQTDLHSDQIKNRMTKAQFVSNNRGIDDGKNLPQEYLELLYDTVQENPFSLKEDDDARIRLASQQAQTAAQKLQLFVKETEEIVQTAQSLLQQPVVERSDESYVTARIAEHACPTFGAACWPLLAAFTTVLQDVDEQTEKGIMELCVEGLKLCARTAARFDMHTKRDALVSALAMFTYLMTLKEIKQKNVECIKALLNIALTDGSRLGASWQHVLQCLSRLEQLQLISAKSQPDFQYFGVESGGAATANSFSGRSVGAAGITTLLSTGNQADDQVEQANSQSVMSQVDSALIDRLFNKTTSLDGSAIVGFVIQLVRVSREELATPDKPRVFSLHKLVEVGDYNMSRPAAVWAQIWEPLSQHLVEVASHPNSNVSMYAVDSLRQLATRFLDKDDGSDNMAVLRPFEVMMFSTRSMSVASKSYVVDAVLNIVQSRTHRIKSGWKVVLRVLAAVSRAIVDEDCIQRGFTAVTAGLRPLFDDYFQETVETIYAFATCQASVATSLEAIKRLRQAADHAVSASGAATPANAEQASPGTHFYSILKCLTDSVGDPRKDVRGAALETLFEILCEHSTFLAGSHSDFQDSCWNSVLTGLIEPLFKSLQPGGVSGEAAAQSAGGSLYLAALKALGRLFEASLVAWPTSVLERAVVLLDHAVRQESEAVADTAVANAAREILRNLASLASEGKGIPEASAQVVKKAAAELLQNGSEVH